MRLDLEELKGKDSRENFEGFNRGCSILPGLKRAFLRLGKGHAF
jgi:hypothetical protein